MRDVDALNILAMTADADARATATLVEIVAAACIMKLATPTGAEPRNVTISPADLEEVTRDFIMAAEYAEDGTMSLSLIRAAE